jgi:transposase
LDWRAKVELYEQIRREYEFGAGSVIGVSRKLGVHRRMVREAVRNAVPAQRKKTERPAVKMAAAMPLVEAILESDRRAPRKQRHTARRIYERILTEVPGCKPAQRTVRQYVERRRQALGLAEHETFVPQSYDWGVEAQIDWYEAYADLDGERVKLQVFSMRSMASGAAFHRAYPCATQQAFLEAHELAFAYFEGVFRVLRYDNLTSAVKKILRGQQRDLTARFIAFRSHWGYRAEFCTPGEGHEKGGVEGEVGYFRRNHWVPVPVATDLAALNRKLLQDCRADESRTISGQTEFVGARLLTEKQHLLPLVPELFDLAEVSYPRVDQTGCAKVRTNSYSVPLKAGSLVEARVSSTAVEFRHDGKRIANHQRCYSRLQKILDLEHYLDVLERKPGALRGSTPLAQWRAQGRWPESYDRIWQQLIERGGRQPGTRAMVELIRMGREFGYEKLTGAIDQALDLGCRDVAAIRHLLQADQLQHVAGEAIEIGALSAYERPLPTGCSATCRRWEHEPRSRQHRPTHQDPAAARRRGTVRLTRRRSRPAPSLASPLSRSPAPGRGRGS